MMKITGLSHLFKWENLHNWWLTKYFFAPLYVLLVLFNVLLGFSLNLHLFSLYDKNLHRHSTYCLFVICGRKKTQS